MTNEDMNMWQERLQSNTEAFYPDSPIETPPALNKISTLAKNKDQKLNNLSGNQLQMGLSNLFTDALVLKDDDGRYIQKTQVGADGNAEFLKERIPDTTLKSYYDKELGETVTYDRDTTRNLYLFGPEAMKGAPAYKAGLADRDAGAKARYNPNDPGALLETQNRIDLFVKHRGRQPTAQEVEKLKYGWETGPEGVQAGAEPLMNTEFEYDAATKYEDMLHHNIGMDAAAKLDQDIYSHYLTSGRSPEFLKTHPKFAAQYAALGSGASEYYNVDNPLMSGGGPTDLPSEYQIDTKPSSGYVGAMKGTTKDRDEMLGESVDIAQSSLVQAWGKANKLLVDSTKAIGNKLGFSQKQMDEFVSDESGIFGTKFDNLAKREVADKITGVMAKTREEQQAGMDDALANIKKGNYAEASFDVFKVLPYMLGDSAGEMAQIAMGAPGIAMAVGARVNMDAEEYEKNNGEKPDTNWFLGSTLTNAAALFGERFLLKSGISGIIEKGVAKAQRTGGVALSTVGEAAQEYFDQVQQEYQTQKEGDKSLVEIATSPEAQLSAVAGGVMGGALRGAGETTSGTLETLNEIAVQQSNKRKKAEEQQKVESGDVTSVTGKVATEATENFLTSVESSEVLDDATKKDATAIRDNTLTEVESLSERLTNLDPESDEYADVESVLETKLGHLERLNTIVPADQTTDTAETTTKETVTKEQLQRAQDIVAKYDAVEDRALTADELNEVGAARVLLEEAATLNTTKSAEQVTEDPVALQTELDTIDPTEGKRSAKRAVEIEAKLDAAIPQVEERLGTIGEEISVLSQDEEANVDQIAALIAEQDTLGKIVTAKETKTVEARQKTYDELIDATIEEGVATKEIPDTKEAREQVREMLKERMPKFSAELSQDIERSDLQLTSAISESKDIRGVVEKGGKKETLQDVTTVTDSTIDSMVKGKTELGDLAKLTMGRFVSKVQERLKQHLSKGAPVQKTLEKIYTKVKEAVTSGNKAVEKLATLTEGEVTSERVMRAAAIAVANVHKSIKSEEDIQANKGIYTPVDYTRVSNIVVQIGKEYMNSYGMRLSGNNVKTNELYAKIGQTILDAAQDLGMVQVQKQRIPLIDMVDADGMRITKSNPDNLVVTQTDGVTYVDEDVVSIVEPEADKGEASIGKAMDTLIGALRPTTYEVPTEQPVTEVPTDNNEAISKEHTEVIQKMNAMKFRIKPEFLQLLKDLKKRKEDLGLSMDQFLSRDPIAKAMIGVNTAGTMLTKTSEQGRRLNRSDNLAKLLDNLEMLDEDFHFNYESAVNTRIHVMQTLLEFQGDKYMARNILSGAEYEIDPSTEEGKQELHVLKEAIADDLFGDPAKLDLVDKSKQPETNKDIAKLKTLDKWVANYNKTGKFHIEDAGKMAKELGMSSPFKAMSLVKAVAELNGVADGKVKTDYMGQFDMSASGVINTLLDLVGEPGVNEILDKLRTGEMDPYMYLNSILEEQTSETYETLKATMAEINENIDIDSRDMAKYTVMKWFYGAANETVAREMSHDLAVDIVMEGVTGFNDDAVAFLNKAIGSNKYVVDVLSEDQSGTPVYDITPDDMKAFESWIVDNIAKPYVELLPKAFPAVVAYHKTMSEIYTGLERLGWDGKIGTAMSAMLGDGNKFKMSTKKAKAMLNMLTNEKGEVEVGGKFIPVNEMFLNQTSLKVNPQHAADAAQLLITMQHLMEEFGEDAITAMTVHDAIYTSPKLLIAAKARFEELLKEVAIKYDFRDMALRELESLLENLPEDQKDSESALEKRVAELRKEIDESRARKKDILTNPEYTTNFFGSKTIEVQPTGKISLDETAKPTKKAPSAEAIKKEMERRKAEKEAEKAKPSSIDKLYTAIESKDTEAIIEAIENIEVSEKYISLKEKVLKNLTSDEITIHEGEDFAGGYGRIWMGDKGAILKEMTTGENQGDTLMKIMSHEIDHGYTYSYIEKALQGKKPAEIIYLQRVLSKLEKAMKTSNFRPEVQERLAYILDSNVTTDNLEAHRISELISVMRNEPKVAEAISGILSEQSKKTLFQHIAKIIKDIVDYVKKIGVDKAREELANDSGVTLPNTLTAMQIVEEMGKVQNAQEAITDTEAEAKAKPEFGKIEELEKAFTKEELKQIKECK